MAQFDSEVRIPPSVRTAEQVTEFLTKTLEQAAANKVDTALGSEEGMPQSMTDSVEALRNRLGTADFHYHDASMEGFNSHHPEGYANLDDKGILSLLIERVRPQIAEAIKKLETDFEANAEANVQQKIKDITDAVTKPSAKIIQEWRDDALAHAKKTFEKQKADLLISIERNDGSYKLNDKGELEFDTGLYLVPGREEDPIIIGADVVTRELAVIDTQISTMQAANTEIQEKAKLHDLNRIPEHQLNGALGERLRPFVVKYCQALIDKDPQSPHLASITAVMEAANKGQGQFEYGADGKLNYRANDKVSLDVSPMTTEQVIDRESKIAELQSTYKYEARQAIREMVKDRGAIPEDLRRDVFQGNFGFTVRPDRSLVVEVLKGDNQGRKFSVGPELADGVFSGKLPAGQVVERPMEVEVAEAAARAEIAASGDEAEIETGKTKAEKKTVETETESADPLLELNASSNAMLAQMKNFADGELGSADGGILRKIKSELNTTYSGQNVGVRWDSVNQAFVVGTLQGDGIHIQKQIDSISAENAPKVFNALTRGGGAHNVLRRSEFSVALASNPNKHELPTLPNPAEKASA